MIENGTIRGTRNIEKVNGDREAHSLGSTTGMREAMGGSGGSLKTFRLPSAYLPSVNTGLSPCKPYRKHEPAVDQALMTRFRRVLAHIR